MSAATKQQLELLRDLTNADSMSEVVRRALAMYDFACNETSAGADIIVRAKDGSEQKILLL